GAGNAEENCETNPGNSAQGSLDKRLALLATEGLCDAAQLTAAASFEATLFGSGPDSLDGRNGAIYCDSSSGALIGDDDTGSVPPTHDVFMCEVSVANAVARLVRYAFRCHVSMNKSFVRGRDFDEEACEETSPIRFRGALDKFNRIRDRLVASNMCPPCLDRV